MPDRTDANVQPFVSGFQFIDWQIANCCECRKYHVVDGEVVEPYCELEESLMTSGMLLGEIPREIADRLGVPEDIAARWECREKEPEVAFTVTPMKGSI